MRIITRGKRESIVLGEGIRVTVADIRGDRVFLEIEVPRGVPVHRAEIYEAVVSKLPPVDPAMGDELPEGLP